jgi:outer membrane lipoprotein-sorting protein
MKQKVLTGAIAAVLGAWCAAAQADEGLDKVIKELDGQFAKVKSYTAKIEMMTDMAFGPGHTQKTEMTGTTEWLRKGEKALIRSEMKGKTIKTEEGKTATTLSAMSAVDDGEFMYALTEEEGQKTVTKSQSQSGQMYKPSGYFDQFKSYFDIKLLKEDKVDGNDCYVFELKMKPMEGAPPSGRQLVYFGKEHGIQVKAEGFDSDGKLISSSVSKDLKINPDISPDHFKFEVPKGAQVIDTTKAQTPPAEAERAGEEPAKKEEPKKEEPKKKEGLKLPKLPGH